MKRKMTSKKNVFILGIGSDIGTSLARYYVKQGYDVYGTYRSRRSISTIMNMAGIRLLKCDLSNKSDIRKGVNRYKALRVSWDIFISCAGTMEPVGRFFEVDFDKWEDSIIINSTSQLRFLHEVYPFRRKNKVCDVVFFAGGGTNNAFSNYSAYCASKILLIKMCELLDDENKDLNTFIVGPGWVRTKIHAQTFKNRSAAGSNYIRTSRFLKSSSPGTYYRDIFECINWCIKQGRVVCGGRNFSVVHDKWRNGPGSLIKELRACPDKFKLRRYKNNG